MSKNVWLKKFLMGIAFKKEKKKLIKASKNGRQTSEKFLFDLLDYAQNTEYGKKYDFANIKSIKEFQKKVPIVSYDDLEPYIIRQTEGKEMAIVPEKPVIYATTSGTTSRPKWIPITPKYQKESYSAMSKLWLGSIIHDNPSCLDGYNLSIVGKADEGKTPDGTSYGSLSGHVYTQIPGFLNDIHAIPYSLLCIPDFHARYYALIRMGVEQNITLFVTGNPSTLIQINKQVIDNSEHIIKDIKNGTLRKEINVPDDIRKDIEAHLKPNPKRAKELENIIKKHGRLLPKYYWPNLAAIVVWKCGNSGLYLKHLEGMYAEKTIIREFGYLASEVRAAIVLDNKSLASIMCSHLAFFEFIKEHERELENPKIYLADELEIGESYYMIVTTTCGMYRYDMNDLMKMEGWYNDFPKMRFIQKGAGVVSLSGEKLTEQQIIKAVEITEEETNIKNNFYIAFADFEYSGYNLYIEFSNKINQNQTEELATLIDAYLKEYNVEYRSKRESDRIKPIRIKSLKKNAYDLYKNHCMSHGERDGQFKLVHLQHNDERMKIFESFVI